METGHPSTRVVETGLTSVYLCVSANSTVPPPVGRARAVNSLRSAHLVACESITQQSTHARMSFRPATASASAAPSAHRKYVCT